MGAEFAFPQTNKLFGVLSGVAGGPGDLAPRWARGLAWR
jgi:hypothetical protein